jgi:hypothetical protein
VRLTDPKQKALSFILHTKKQSQQTQIVLVLEKANYYHQSVPEELFMICMAWQEGFLYGLYHVIHTIMSLGRIHAHTPAYCLPWSKAPV